MTGWDVLGIVIGFFIGNLLADSRRSRKRKDTT